MKLFVTRRSQIFSGIVLPAARCVRPGQHVEASNNLSITKRVAVAQAEPSRSDVPSEVRLQWNQHQTLEICIFITPDTEMILAASCVTGYRRSLCPLCCILPWYAALVASLVCLFLYVFKVISVECSIKKNDVGLQITPCCSTVYKLALRMYRPCVHMMT
jgi:hypothetical protein